MKIILSAIIFATSLLCGVQGSGQCIEASFCGCQLLDANNKSLFNITLDFADNKYDNKFIVIVVAVSPFKNISRFVKHEEDILLEYKYTYSPCSKNSDCTESNATAETSAVSYKLLGDQLKEPLYCRCADTISGISCQEIESRLVGKIVSRTRWMI